MGADEVTHCLRYLHQSQDPGERRGGGQNEENRGKGADGLLQNTPDVPNADGAIHHQADEQGVEHRNHGSLRGRGHAGVDAAQNDDGAEDGKEALPQHPEQALLVQLAHRRPDLHLVLPVLPAVEHRVAHQQQADHKAGDNACQEQVAHRSPRGHAVHNEGNAGGDDDPQPPRHRHNGGGEGQLIAQGGEDGDGHAAHRRHGGGGGAGDGPVEQAGNHHGAGHAGGAVAQKVGEHVKQLPGDAALGHDDAGQHEHGYRQ